MEPAAARERFAVDAVMFPVDFSRVSEESGREALEALRKAVAGEGGFGLMRSGDEPRRRMQSRVRRCPAAADTISGRVNMAAEPREGGE